MADLKKKFIDILFEEDSDEQELIEDSYEKEDLSEKPKKESTILAKDILYRKPGASAFINLNETHSNNQTVIEEEVTNENYEMSSQISPVFGLIKENEKKVFNVSPEITETQTIKPSDSHLDIITSPIYGYGNKEDAIDNNYEVRNIVDDYENVELTEDETAELHHLFDDEDKLNKSYDTLETSTDDEEISLFKLFGDNN